MLRALPIAAVDAVRPSLSCTVNSASAVPRRRTLRDPTTFAPAVAACMLMVLPITAVDAVHARHCCWHCWLQVGGLADVVTSLAKAHQATGTLVEIVLPKYDCANYGPIDQLRHLTDFEVAWNGKTVLTKAWCGVVEGLPVYMLEPQQPAAFFWRGAFYGQVGHRMRTGSLRCWPGGRGCPQAATYDCGWQSCRWQGSGVSACMFHTPLAPCKHLGNFRMPAG